MRGKLATVAVLTVAVAACTSDGTPATTPTSISATTSTVTTTLPPETTTTTAAATTTTLDRLLEIEAIFQDLEERRLQALYEGDREAFQALFANNEYMTRSMGAFEVVEFVDGWQSPTVVVVEVLTDAPSCIAAMTATDFTGVFVGSDPRDLVEVIENSGGGWGLSYAGEGWTCDGPHPLSP